MGTAIESSVKFVKRGITLFCVISRMIRSDLSFFKQFNGMSYRLGLESLKIVQSGSFSYTSNVIHLVKVYSDHVHVSFESYGCTSIMTQKT